MIPDLKSRRSQSIPDNHNHLTGKEKNWPAFLPIKQARKLAMMKAV